MGGWVELEGLDFVAGGGVMPGFERENIGWMLGGGRKMNKFFHNLYENQFLRCSLLYISKNISVQHIKNLNLREPILVVFYF